jgi:hypothetical protein
MTSRHDKLMQEERDDILAQCEKEGLRMDICHAMTFKELRDMWSDYQSDMAMMEGRNPGV